MKGFLEDIVRLAGISPSAVGHRYTVINGKSIFIEGIKFIKSFSPAQIVVVLAGSEILSVEGEGLWISRLNSCEILIDGRITRVELL